MDERTLEALKASIANWERNAKVEKMEDAKLGVINCPLCNMFWLDDCKGCPVAKNTGTRLCAKTPYHDAEDELENGNIESFRKAALAEVEFLKSLLPEGERDGPSP
ncbi:hypothetical protein [Rhizobium alvei]|uniref:Uncharacterized protein n=1 Tax=Rhizobium alvei TaxID=1132659 RepID=A0ABT8YTT6_9HYPH|nr:hypothetical protein [Rhizobium alvei]MDO6966935.1 hypothetical protein [Rhizobium alvei]